MNRHYALARSLATMDSIPELIERLNQIGERFERARQVAGPDAAPQLVSVFETAYSTAAQAIEQSNQPGRAPQANELVAIESLLSRAEQSMLAYEQTVAPSPSPSRASVAGGGALPLLVGALVLGGVLYLSRT